MKQALTLIWVATQMTAKGGITMWLDIRDRINNKMIRFLLRHCGLDSITCRAFVRKVELLELEALIDEKRIRRDCA